MALVRCPTCNTFVKPASLDAGLCAFCPSARKASLRNPIPGVVLATVMAVSPACSADKAGPDTKPPPSTNQGAGQEAALETTTSKDASPNPGNTTRDAEQSDKSPDAVSPDVVSPDAKAPDVGIPAKPRREVTIYGGPPDTDDL